MSAERREGLREAEWGPLWRTVFRTEARTASQQERDLRAAVERILADRLAAQDRASDAGRRLRDLTSRLGFGDGVTEPMADNDTIVEFVESAVRDQSNFHEAPITCEECGDRLAADECPDCHGSGCGPGTASGAYDECGRCTGTGRVHAVCVGLSYADLAARGRDHEVEVADLRSRLACIEEAAGWDRPYDTRLEAIRGLCDLSTNGMTPHAVGEEAGS